MATVLTHLPCRSRVPHFSKNALQIQQYIATLCLCSPVRRISHYYGRVGDINKDASTVYYGNWYSCNMTMKTTANTLLLPTLHRKSMCGIIYSPRSETGVSVKVHWIVISNCRNFEGDRSFVWSQQWFIKCRAPVD